MDVSDARSHGTCMHVSVYTDTYKHTASLSHTFSYARTHAYNKIKKVQDAPAAAAPALLPDATCEIAFVAAVCECVRKRERERERKREREKGRERKGERELDGWDGGLGDGLCSCM